MARSSRRSLFLVVFILVLCGFLGMLFGQKINPGGSFRRRLRCTR